jgi:hypothetical protein
MSNATVASAPGRWMAVNRPLVSGRNPDPVVAADPAQITDEKSAALIDLFNAVTDADGLAFYPDWPARATTTRWSRGYRS